MSLNLASSPTSAEFLAGAPALFAFQPAAPIGPTTQPSSRRRVSEHRKWASSEVRLLIDLGLKQRLPNAQIAEVLRGRTITAVKHKLGQIANRGHRKWKAKEVARLKELARSNSTLDEIAEALNRTAEACRYKIRNLGLEKQKPPNWDEAAVSYLRANYSTASMDELCAHLNRTSTAICVKASRLALTNTRRTAEPSVSPKAQLDLSIWSAEMITKLRSLASAGYTMPGVRNHLKRSTAEILAVAEENAIHLRPRTHWDKNLTNRLRALAAQRLTRSEIAGRMGFRADYVAAKARLHGIRIVKDLSWRGNKIRFAPGEQSVDQIIERLTLRPRSDKPTESCLHRRPGRRLPSAGKKPMPAGLSREEEIARISKFLRDNTATKAGSLSIVDEAVRFLRCAGDIVFTVGEADEAKYRVNYSMTLSRVELVGRANALRQRRGLSPLLHLAAEAPRMAIPMTVQTELPLAACA